MHNADSYISYLSKETQEFRATYLVRSVNESRNDWSETAELVWITAYPLFSDRLHRLSILNTGISAHFLRILSSTRRCEQYSTHVWIEFEYFPMLQFRGRTTP